MQEVSPYADFERIFSTFASAEEVTGAKPVDQEEEEGDNEASVAAKPAVPPPPPPGRPPAILCSCSNAPLKILNLYCLLR